MKRKYLIVSLLILVSVLSCNFIEETTNNAGLSGNTTLDLPISYNLSSVSRTLATDYGITVSSVTVVVENDLFTYGPEVLTFDATTDVASGTIEDIVEGTYTVTLSAYMLDNDSNPVLVAEGMQAEVSIVSDQTTNVNISMSIVVGLGDLVVNGSIAQIPRDGLVVEYLFNGDANDTSGNNLHGTVYGAILTTDRNGNSNSAYIFDGVDDYIDLGNNTNINDNLVFSYSIWINVPSNDNLMTVISNTQGSGLGIHLNHPNYNDSIISVAHNHSNYSVVGSSSNVLDSSWHHIVVTFGEENYVLYIDNVEVNQMDISSLTFNTSIYPTFIGAEPDSYTPSSFLLGNIDDVRIYNRQITSDEVSLLFCE